MEFHPAPFHAPLRAFAVLAFGWKEGQVLVCDIKDRGWCVPSGRVEPGESSMDAARREAMEEGGAEFDSLHYIGCYKIIDRRDERWVDCFVGRITALVDLIEGGEAKERRLVDVGELRSLYHLWNPLTELVFRHAVEVLGRNERA